MNKILPLVFALSFMITPVLALGEGGFSLSDKNKKSHDERVEQVDSSYSIDR